MTRRMNIHVEAQSEFNNSLVLNQTGQQSIEYVNWGNVQFLYVYLSCCLDVSHF